MRRRELEPEDAVVDLAHADDACHMGDEQTRDRGGLRVELQVDGQALLAQALEDLREADRAGIVGVEADTAVTFELDAQAAFGLEQLGDRTIQRRLEADA